MENELTQKSVIPYPIKRGNMDENGEEKKQEEKVVTTDTGKKEEEKKKPIVIPVGEEKKLAAKKAWEEANKKKEAKGEVLTDEEKEVQRQQIERGMGPIGGGSADGYYEHFDPERFKNTSLYDLGKQIKELGLQSQVTPEVLVEITKTAADLHAVGKVDDDKYNQFIAALRRIGVAKVNDVPLESEGGIRPPEAGASAGTGGDGIFDSINMWKFVDTPLEPIATQILNLGKAKVAPTQQMLTRWLNDERQLLAEGKITPEQHDIFTEELDGLLKTAQAEQQGGRGREGGTENSPKSIQGVCRWIIAKEGDEWGPDGPNALLDSEGKFNKGNFLKWVRERMLFYDGFSPDDPNLNLLGAIGTETDFRNIGLQTMINNKAQYFRDEETGEVYDDFSEDIVNEVFLFQTSRGFDAAYRFKMWSDEELPKFLQEIHQRSIFTNTEQMKKIFSFASDYGSGDTKVGDTIRKSYEVFYHMSDLEKLKEVLGENNEFFTREGFKKAYWLSQGLAKDAPIPDNYNELFDSLFDSSGKAKPKEFISYINLFNETGKLQSTVKLVREAVRLGVSDLYGLDNGLEYDPANEAEKKKRFTRRKNLEYAERWAYSMARWTGAGARNDTGAIGYDAQAKAMRFQQYRLRQAKAERGGAFGNEYDLPVLKNLTLDFFNGIFVEKAVGESKNFTPFELFEQLDAFDKQAIAIRNGRKDEELSEAELAQLREIDKQKEPVFGKLKFKQFTELDYASNHIGRSWGIFHRLMGAEELNIEQIVKHEPWRGLVFDRAKFEEQVKEGFIKPIRYAFKTYGNIDYSKKMRIQTGTGADGAPLYKEVTMAEAMFGPAVLEGFYKKVNGKKVIDEEKLKKEESRTILYKNVVRAIIASHIKAHRQRFSGYKHTTKEGVDMFYEALESIREMEIEEDDGGVSLKRGEGFFSEHDIKWMRKYSDTGSFKMAVKDYSFDVTAGVGKGLWEAFGEFWKSSFK